MSGKIGQVEKIENSMKESHLESSHYYRVVVYTGEGYKNLLLTSNDIEKFEEREKKNEEDCIKPSWWNRFLRWLML